MKKSTSSSINTNTWPGCKYNISKINKNGLAIADKAVQELEKEIVKICPESRPLLLSELLKATIVLNSRIRNSDLSSHEIMFSREQQSGKNLLINDSELAERKD